MAKGILEEIRSQPSHIREIFMWSCVAVVFSVIGFSWFRSTTQQFAALVNPEQYQLEKTILAEQEQKENQSPFATILTSLKGMGANISELFDFTKKGNNIEIENINIPEVEPNLLPLSGDK